MTEAPPAAWCPVRAVVPPERGKDPRGEGRHERHLRTDRPRPPGRPAARVVPQRPHNVDLDDPADYWYRLGQRNAYAHAVGLTLGRAVDDVAFAVADRVTTALGNGVHDLGDLTLTASGRAPSDPAPTSLAWVGPQAFKKGYGHLPGIDRDYGMRWGERHEQRITLRRTANTNEGLLYAYDPTWDEYAVISTRAPVDAVEAAFTQAVQVDVHMTVPRFAEIYARQVMVRIGSMEPHPSRGVEL